MRRLAVPGVDLLGLAPRADRVHRLHRRLAQLDAPAASPYCSRSSGRYSHSEERKPPLRPLGPIPQRSASSTTTRAFGSRLARSPTPSTARCSRRRRPRRRRRRRPLRAGTGAGAPASAIHQPCASCIISRHRRLDRRALDVAQPLRHVAAHRVARDARRAGPPAPRGSPGWRPAGGAASSRPRGRRSRRPPQHSSASATARSVHSRKPGTVTAMRPSGSLAAASWPAPISSRSGPKARIAGSTTRSKASA